MPQDFDALFNQYMSELDSLGSAPSQEQAPFDVEAYLASLGIKKKPTGILKGTTQSVGRGVGKAVSTFGKSLEYDQNQRPDLVNTIGSYIDDFGNTITQAVPQPFADKGSQREAWFQAMESTPTSLAMGLPSVAGAALGSFGGPVGTVAGATAGGALTYPVMQQATAQETYETLKARRPDLSEDVIRDMAAKTGYWEAGPEAATNIAEGILFNTTPLGRGVAPFVKAFGKNVLKAAPLEMAGEAATGYGQAKTLQQAFPELDPVQEALHGANVAAYMSLAMAGGGTIFNKLAQPKETQPSDKPIVDNQTSTDLINKEPVPLQDTLRTVQPSMGKQATPETTAALANLLAKVNKTQPVVTEPEIGDMAGTDVKPVITLQPDSKIQAIARLVDSANKTEFRKQFKSTKQGTVVVPSSVIKELNVYLQDPRFNTTQAAKDVANLVAEQEQTAVEEGIIFPATQEGVQPTLVPEQDSVDMQVSTDAAPIVQQQPVLDPTEPVQTELPLTSILASPTVPVTENPISVDTPISLSEEPVNTQTPSGKTVLRKAGSKVQQDKGTKVIVPEQKPHVVDYTTLSDSDLEAAAKGNKLKKEVARELSYRKAKASLFEQASKTKETDTKQVSALVASVDRFNTDFADRIKLDITDSDRIDTITTNARNQETKLYSTKVAPATTEQPVEKKISKAQTDEDLIVAKPDTEEAKQELLDRIKNKFNYAITNLDELEAQSFIDALGDIKHADTLDEKLTIAQTELKESKHKIPKVSTKHAAKAKSEDTSLNKVVKESKDTKATLDTISKAHKNKIVSSIAGMLRDMNLNVKTKIVKDLKDEDGDASIGLYSDGLVELDTDSFNDTDMSAIYVHEVIHHAINNKLSNKNFAIYKTRLNQLKSEIRKQLTKKGLDPDLFYGVREGVHIEELITEAFTNEDLQLALESVKLPEPKSKYIKTLLDKFVDVVRQILGFKAEQHTALKEVIALGLEAIEFSTNITEDIGDKKAAKSDDASAHQKLDYMLETTKQGKNLLDGLVKTFESNFPNADKFFTYMFRNPLWLAEKMRTEGDEAAEYMVRGVENREKRTEDFNDLKEDFLGATEGKPALKSIAEKFASLDPTSQFMFLKLVHASDMNNVKYNSIQEAMQAKTQDGDSVFRRDKTLSKEIFSLYNELNSYSKGLFLQSFNTSRNLALSKLNKSVAKKMEKLLKLETWLEEDADFKAEARAILNREGLSSEIVTEALEDVLSARGALKRLRDTFTERQFYMPRIRKPGPYKLQVFEKDKNGERGREIYSASFASDAIRASVMVNLDSISPAMGLNAKLRDIEFVESYSPKGAQVDPGGFNVIATDSFLDDVMNRAQRMGSLSDKEAQSVRKAMAQHTAETILAMSGSGKHKIKRMEDYVSGFETNPIQAFLTYSESLANSYAKAKYVQSQIEVYGAIKKANPKASEYFLEYMKTTTAPRTGFDNISSKVRYAATIYFMGGSISSAIINLSQNPILGIPTLIKLGVTGPKAAKTLGRYFKMVAPQVTKDMFTRLKLSGDMLALESHVQESPKGLSTGLDTILQWYRKSGLNLDTQTSVSMGADEDRMSDKLASRFQTVADKLMAPFKAVEIANRESTLLAAADILAAKQGINLMTASEEQLESLYAESKRIVNQVHFMGSGNLPMYAQKHASMRTMLAMQSYGINFLNIIYNSLSSGDKKEYAHVARIFGMMALVGGMFGAIPFSDEANKVLRRMLGRDLKLEAQKEIGKLTGDELAHVILHGPFNIANNISLRVPDPFGLVGMLTDGTEAGIYSAGALGSIVNRMVKAMDYASDGQWSKAVGIGSPEAFGRMVRAYQEYNEGFTSAKGAPVYFKGEKLKATLPQALLKGIVGIKTPTETRIADVRFTKFELEQRWRDKRSVAVNKFAKGDRQAMIDFNESLRDNDQARALIKPITGSDKIRALRRKTSDKDMKFEREYS